MTTALPDIRLQGRAPAPDHVLARRLWLDGVYSTELLAVASRWADADAAFLGCPRLELAMPLAVQRGVPMERIVRVARLWVIDVRQRTGDLGWPMDDRILASSAIGAALGPGPDVAHLVELRDRCLERAGAKDPGRHRYRLLTAIAHTANLGIRRVRQGLGAGADGELVAEHLLGLLRDHVDGADLFTAPVDVDGFTTGALDVARSELM